MTTTLYNYDGSSQEYGYDCLLTPSEAASALRLTTRTLALWSKQGKLRCLRLSNGVRRYPEDAVRAVFEGRFDDAATPEYLAAVRAKREAQHSTE